jgi:hypothetical protein
MTRGHSKRMNRDIRALPPQQALVANHPQLPSSCMEILTGILFLVGGMAGIAIGVTGCCYIIDSVIRDTKSALVEDASKTNPLLSEHIVRLSREYHETKRALRQLEEDMKAFNNPDICNSLSLSPMTREELYRTRVCN